MVQWAVLSTRDWRTEERARARQRELKDEVMARGLYVRERWKVQSPHFDSQAGPLAMETLVRWASKPEA